MRKIYILILATLLISGCTNRDGTPTVSSKKCYDGVLYYRMGHGVAPAYNTDGSLKLCGVKS